MHDLKSAEASNINNTGKDAQIDYIIDCGATVDEEGAETTADVMEKPEGWDGSKPLQ